MKKVNNELEEFRQRKKVRKKLTLKDKIAIKEEYYNDPKASLRKIADKYGVSQTAIHKIVKGQMQMPIAVKNELVEVYAARNWHSCFIRAIPRDAIAPT